MWSNNARNVLGLAGTVLTSFALATNTSSNRTQATFVSPSNNFAFALTVPADNYTNNVDLYFTLTMSTSLSWGAVGLGSDTMSNALVLMIYESNSGKNVTFSPRLATGHSEPPLYQELNYTALPGAAIVNGTLVYSAVCHNCHSWPGGGTLDIQSSAVKAIYATGPSGSGKSNNRAAPLKYHSDYGSFTIDMRSALGPAAAPVLDGKSLSAGTTLHDSESGQRDWVAIIHAVVMVFCFMGLMPLGVVILRVGEWVSWHGVNQGIAMVGVICGFGLGVKTGLLYIRSKNFSSAHQIVGLIATVSIVVQFLLGFFHHRIYKNTKQPTKLAPIHVWLGRVTVVLGIFNGFLGFPLAVESKYNYVLAGLVIAIVSITFFILFWKRFFHCRRERKQMAPIQVAYDPHPWRNTAPSNYGRWLPDQQQNGNGMDDVTLSTLDRAHGERKVEANARTRSLESYQTPRDYL